MKTLEFAPLESSSATRLYVCGGAKFGNCIMNDAVQFSFLQACLNTNTLMRSNRTRQELALSPCSPLKLTLYYKKQVQGTNDATWSDPRLSVRLLTSMTELPGAPNDWCGTARYLLEGGERTFSLSVYQISVVRAQLWTSSAWASIITGSSDEEITGWLSRRYLWIKSAGFPSLILLIVESSCNVSFEAVSSCVRRTNDKW